MTIALGSWSAVATTAQPSAEPLRAGLTISGSPRRSTSAAITSAAPSSRKVSCGRQTDSGVCSPARVTTVLATGLSKAAREAEGVAPTYGMESSSRISRIAPSSPVSPCSIGTTQDGRSARSDGEQAGVDVALGDLDAGAAQRLGDPAARAQRHVALVAEPAGQDEDGVVAHALAPSH